MDFQKIRQQGKGQQSYVGKVEYYEKEEMEGRPKIEIVRVSSIERGNFRPLDGIQLHAAYSHVRIGTYCPEPPVEIIKPSLICEKEHPRKFKKNLGPVSRLLRRRHQTSTCLATKSCDNIYSVNRSSHFFDWKSGENTNNEELQTRQSNSLDWRVGRTVNSSVKLDWRDASRSAEQLSRSAPLSSGHLRTPSTKSKLVSLLRRLSPRLSRPGSKGSLQSSPTVCPWVQVEYSRESMGDNKREESQESDVSFQRELQLNELKKRMAGIATTSQVTVANLENSEKAVEKDAVAVESDLIVHEDRGDKEPDRQQQQHHQQQQHQQQLQHHQQRREILAGKEVAGLESDTGNSTVTVIPGSTGKATRRLRPLSLAVQPLNYHQLDPDPDPVVKHPNMTSQESIGSCSLDVDKSASDRSETTVGSVSEKTLHSLNLSCNGETSSPKGLQNGGNSNETLQCKELSPNENIGNISNGHQENAEPEQLTAKKPSYLGLACSISGYSGITRYDSKLREGFRSRDSSPGTRLITRDTSPAGFRSNENLNIPTHSYPTKSQSISPLAMDRQNGFTNGIKEECKIESSYSETRTSISMCQGFSEVDKGVPLHTTFPDISPIRANSPIKRTPGVIHMISYKETKSFSSSISGNSPKSTAVNVSNTTYSESSFLNGSSIEADPNVSCSSEKSFIQQRVERLYGPGALAQGFFFKRSASKLNTSTESSFNKSSNNNDITTDNANIEESLKNLPVLRHLRPEFRAQLPVVSPRKPTDGSEQIIKPLQRLSVSTPRKNESKEDPKNVLSNNALENSLSLSASVTSIPDQQPAAPKVVLPVLEPSASSTSIANQAQETKEAVEEKDGHYFMKILKTETERLLSLAAGAEAELSSSDPTTMPEEAAGKLRVAAGKARLLASQKIQQFEGLCQKNINQMPDEAFPTTNEDLAGFWDMVMLQVIQVNELFDQIEKLKNSQWQEVVSDKKATSQNGSVKRRVAVSKAKPTANSEANRKAREAREQARRKMIEERRKAMKSNQQNSDNSVKIFAPDT